MARRNRSEVRRRRKAKKEKEELRKKKSEQSRQRTHEVEFRKLLNWLLPTEGIFSSLVPHGNTSWLFRTLVFLALCWSWAENRNAVDSFKYGSKWCQTLSGAKVLSTYQGMMNALERWTAPLMKILWKIVHQRMKQIGGEFWETDGWVPIAFDGSRDSAPRTESNEAAYCAPNHGHGTTAKYRRKKAKGMRRTMNEKNKPAAPKPQLWITLMWHMGLRLPWTWRLGPSNASERADVMEMLEHEDFPENTLFCGDAGFVGHPLWSAIISRGHHFLVRVGGNVSLLVERSNAVLKENMTVLSWPEEAMHADKPPLRLRLVKVRVGKTWMWLLTDVLSKEQLSVKMIRQFYQQRWGIEVEFRGLKQTLDNAKLRCRTAARTKVELHWSLLGMTVAELFALKEQLAPPKSPLPAAGPQPDSDADPSRRSLAATIFQIRWSLTHLSEAPALRADSLTCKLRGAKTDNYDRRSSKAARYRPPNPDKKPLGDPKIKPLNDRQKQKLRKQKHHDLTG